MSVISHTTPDKSPKVALLGFGEAAQAFVKGWQTAGIELDLAAYDIKSEDEALATRRAKARDYSTANVTGVASLAELLSSSTLCFSLVTADQAGKAAENAALHIKPGTLFLDANSCAPSTKITNAERIEAAGGHYVDMAIMAPVYPLLIGTPVLLSGPHATRAQKALSEIGMNVSTTKGDVGQASSIKMIRSIMVKGIEALSAECALAARAAGVQDEVFDSLNASWPDAQWRTRSSYNLERMMVHGQRRAAEMREVAKTVSALGLNNGMSKAVIEWQQQIGALRLSGGEDDLSLRTDRILAALAAAKDRKG